MYNTLKHSKTLRREDGSRVRIVVEYNPLMHGVGNLRPWRVYVETCLPKKRKFVREWSEYQRRKNSTQQNWNLDLEIALKHATQNEILDVANSLIEDLQKEIDLTPIPNPGPPSRGRQLVNTKRTRS